MNLEDFPLVNATLNGTSAVLLLAGYIAIKFRRVRTHVWLMLSALVSSTLFLAFYLTYHELKRRAGSTFTKFPDNAFRPIYLTILTTHTILAVVILPMIFMTLLRAYRRQWDKHRRIARPTFWTWLYVSVTGVVIYILLYQVFSPGTK